MFNTIFLQADGGSMLSLLPYLAIFVVMYFFFLRPQMAKAKKEKTFQAEIRRGAKVVTSSGIHGKIVDLNDADGTVTIETGAGKIKFERSAISMELSKRYLAPAKK